MGRLAGLLLCALLGCDASRPPDAASAPPVPAAEDVHQISFGPWQVRAVGDAEGEVLHVHRLELRRDGDPEPVQLIEGLQTDTPWPADRPGLEAVDMDFDGHADLRLIEFRAAGPNTPWRHWRFDPASARFVASPELDALSPTRFDAARHEVIVDWRDGADRAGRDVFTWRDGRLVRVTIGP